jgi:methylenetetrahydrofolate dehydrogenase (NADP+)/methenyltetrahydrofolate cyclohydrolase
MTTIISGTEIAEKINKQTAKKIALLKKKNISPKLAVVLVGNNKPSQIYVHKKEEAAKKIGIDFLLERMPANSSKKQLVNKINNLQKNNAITGLIVQLPLPEPLYTAEVLNAIKPEIDVDCLTNENLGKLIMKTNFISPPTPAAVMEILQELNVNLIGKNVTIIGMGALVGKPLAIMMANARASVTTCNSKTNDTKEKCLKADIIITGVGKKDLLQGNMVSKGAIVIDTGVVFENNKMFGDINFKEVIKKASFVTPTPCGVGPITVAKLLLNTAICAEKIYDANI